MKLRCISYQVFLYEVSCELVKNWLEYGHNLFAKPYLRFLVPNRPSDSNNVGPIIFPRGIPVLQV